MDHFTQGSTQPQFVYLSFSSCMDSAFGWVSLHIAWLLERLGHLSLPFLSIILIFPGLCHILCGTDNNLLDPQSICRARGMIFVSSFPFILASLFILGEFQGTETGEESLINLFRNSFHQIVLAFPKRILEKNLE